MMASLRAMAAPTVAGDGGPTVAVYALRPSRYGRR